jgi:imidazolonepropionase
VGCHSHPLFAGSRHAEYANRLAGANLAEIAAAGGGIWASVVATREATDEQLTAELAGAYRRSLAGGVTTLEVKSGYGLTAETELHQLKLLAESRSHTPLQLMISFLGAHVVPAGSDAEAYTGDVLAMLETVVSQGLADFHDITCEAGLFTPEQALRMLRRSQEPGILTRTHSDACVTRPAVSVAAPRLNTVAVGSRRRVGFWYVPLSSGRLQGCRGRRRLDLLRRSGHQP